MNAESRVSAIVPSYRGGAALRECLTALAASEPPLHEIVVVVDGDDRDLETGRDFPGVRVLATRRRSGPAGARNLGARSATGEILFFVDADVRVPPDLVTRLSAVLVSHPRFAAVFGSYDRAPADPGFVSQYRNLMHHYVHQTSNAAASSFWSGCGGIRREAFLAVGGFDESYSTPSVEDIELGYRLRHAGYEIALAKDLQVCHLKRWRLLSLWRTELFARAIPWSRLILSERKMPNDLNLRSPYVASVGLAWGALLALAIGAAAGAFTVGILLALAQIALLIAVNLPALRFLGRTRSPRFALATLPLQLVHFLICGLGFAVAAARLAFDRKARAAGGKGRPEPLSADVAEVPGVAAIVDSAHAVAPELAPGSDERGAEAAARLRTV